MHKKRVFIGLGVGAITLGIIFFAPGILQLLVILAFALASQAEFYAIAKKGNFRVYDRLGLIAGAVGGLLTCYSAQKGALLNFPGWEMAFLALCCFVIMMSALFDSKTKDLFSSSCITCLGIIYVPFMLSFMLRLAQWDADAFYNTTRGGMYLVLFIVVVTKMSDTGAFAIGVPFGKHKMFPRVSPKKSWEGLIGGLVTGIGCGMLVAWLASKYQWGPAGIFYSAVPGSAPRVSLCSAAVISAVLVIVGVFGDLVESMFKRTVDVKDSSLVFPAMGGILDVADSLIFVAPCLYYILLWI